MLNPTTSQHERGMSSRQRIAPDSAATNQIREFAMSGGISGVSHPRFKEPTNVSARQDHMPVPDWGLVTSLSPIPAERQ